MPEWQCTYRLQINADFDFQDLAEVADYLRALGVSHAYLSPILQAAKGSMHGYDVADATRINPEWGGEEVYTLAVNALGANGLGQLLDIVPNHMSISTPANPWWWDVLEKGPGSAYLHYFDFGWKHDRDDFEPLRLPVLEDRYVRVLNAGKITLAKTDTDLRLEYASSWAFPLAWHSYPSVLATISGLAPSPKLAALARAFDGKPLLHHELWQSLNHLLQDADVAGALQEGLDRFNAGAENLHAVIEQQFYRLAYWRTASESWFYRRFFDINTLAGFRIEQDDVFLVRHRRELRLAKSGVAQGLRIDHIDGLRYPRRYLEALRAEVPEGGIWVEKILAQDEVLPPEWPIQGTTGYEYLNQLNGLFIQPAGEAALTKIYHEFTGTTASFEEVLNEAKREVVVGLFGGELGDLVELFWLAAAERAEGRDWSRRDIEHALLEYIVSLPVYRTYVEDGPPSPAQVQLISGTVSEARKGRPDIEPELFDFLDALLSMQFDGAKAHEFVLRCQQLTGPAMAKGAEDTSFYRYCRLLSLNEVGGAPGGFGTSLEAWHAFCGAISSQWPLNLVATSTHDTKRGEDARQRLNVLSEAPEAWAELLSDLRAIVERLQATAPGKDTQYFFYQTLIGSWPLDAERAGEYMLKAVREAKHETSWSAPNEAYEKNLGAFIQVTLADSEFRSRVEQFVDLIDASARRNSLVQTVLKLTVPGVPDIYRGTEVFSYSLVDPDNRRPLDFGKLRTLLDEVLHADYDPEWERSNPDAAKLWLIHRTLALRGIRAAEFIAAYSYQRLDTAGEGRDRIVAFLRGSDICVVAARWFLREGDASAATLTLPEGGWLNAFTGNELQGRVCVEDILGALPVAVLERRA